MEFKFKGETSSIKVKESRIAKRAREHLDKLDDGDLLTNEDLASALGYTYHGIKSSGLWREIPDYTTIAVVRVRGLSNRKRIFGNKETMKEWVNSQQLTW